MSAAFFILAVLLLAGALGAVLFSRLVHGALGLIMAFASLAAFYLQLGAEFVGFAQVLIYVGAVAILIVFVMLLTRNAGNTPDPRAAPGSWLTGMAIASLVFGCIAVSVLTSPAALATAPEPVISTHQIGEKLMSLYVLPLEVLGLLLTAAAIGAAVIALGDGGKDTKPGGPP